MHITNSVATLLVCVLLVTSVATHAADQQKSDTENDIAVLTRIRRLPTVLRDCVGSFLPTPTVRLQQLRSLLQHPGCVNNVGIVPSDNSVIVGSNQCGSHMYIITRWDSSTGRCLQTLHGAADNFRLVGLKNDGELLNMVHNLETTQYVNELWNGTIQTKSQKIKLIAYNKNKTLKAASGKYIIYSDPMYKVTLRNTDMYVELFKLRTMGVISAARLLACQDYVDAQRPSETMEPTSCAPCTIS